MSEEEGIPASEPTIEEPANEGQPAPSGDYHDRIRTEPDFAVGEIQKKDRYINELHETTSKFKGLEDYVAAAGGPEALAELASFGHQIRSNPQLMSALQRIQSGEPEPQAKAPEPEEEIFDPEVKALKEEFSSLFAEQKATIADLQQRLNRAEVGAVQTSLAKNVEKALSMFSDDPESLQAAQAKIQGMVETSERQAAAGDRTAAQNLENLAGPMGAQTLEMMVFDIYKDRYVARKLEGSQPSQANAEVMSKATDSRQTTPPATPTPTISIQRGAKVTSSLVKDIMEQTARKLGSDPDRLFGH